MSGLGESSDGHVGNILGIHERFRHMSSRQCDVTRQDQRQEIAFGEILIEPAGAHNGPVETAFLHDALAGLGVWLSASRQQDEMLHALRFCAFDKVPDRLLGGGHGEVRRVADIYRAHASQHGVPAGRLIPIEGGRAGP